MISLNKHLDEIFWQLMMPSEIVKSTNRIPKMLEYICKWLEENQIEYSKEQIHRIIELADEMTIIKKVRAYTNFNSVCSMIEEPDCIYINVEPSEIPETNHYFGVVRGEECIIYVPQTAYSTVLNQIIRKMKPIRGFVTDNEIREIKAFVYEIPFEMGVRIITTPILPKGEGIEEKKLSCIEASWGKNLNTQDIYGYVLWIKFKGLRSDILLLKLKSVLSEEKADTLMKNLAQIDAGCLYTVRTTSDVLQYVRMVRNANGYVANTTVVDLLQGEIEVVNAYDEVIIDIDSDLESAMVVNDTIWIYIPKKE